MKVESVYDKEYTELFKVLEEKFGRVNQLAVAIEECAELQKELTKAVRGKSNDMRIAEEVADLMICLQQILLMYDPGGTKTQLFVDFKLKRLQEFFVEGAHK